MYYLKKTVCLYEEMKMKLKTMFSITSILLMIWGGLMFFSEYFWGLATWSAEPTDVEFYLARAGASLLIGLGVMLWIGREAQPSKARDAIVVGVVVANVLAVVTNLIGIFAGKVPTIVWGGVVLNGLIALGFYMAGWPGKGE